MSIILKNVEGNVINGQEKFRRIQLASSFLELIDDFDQLTYSLFEKLE